MLAALSIKALSILTVAVFNSRSDTARIPVISESLSGARSVSLNCVFCLLVGFVIFFLIPQLMYQIKATAVN